MTHLLYTLSLCVFVAAAFAQPNIDRNAYIENPRMFAENQEPAHVPLVPFPDVDSAKTVEFANSPYHQSLDGVWKFHFSERPEDAPDSFHEATFNDSAWGSITVPSVWQTEGYGHVIYRNIPQALHPYDPPRVPDAMNPTGLYRRSFEIPAEWDGRDVYLHFDGVKAGFFVYVNGEYVGYDQGSMTAAEFNITSKLKQGANTIAVMVLRWTDGSYLEDQDMWRFSGIYRSVYLYSAPQSRIRDYTVVTDLDRSYRDATLVVTPELIGSGEVRARLFDDDGAQVAEFQGSGEIRATIANPAKWSAEKPNLYTLTLELLDSAGGVIDVVSSRIGFREVEVKDKQIHLNGVPINFAGVNRHEHSAETGRTMTMDLMLKDVELMKQFNVNAVRHSHYPNDPRWYDLADEHGLYLFDEANLECHYGLYLSDVPAWTPAFLDRWERMIERNKNHPSVLVWSTGNECGLGRSHFAMADRGRTLDPTRLLYHQNNKSGPDVREGYASFADIDGPRYPTPARLRATAETTELPIVMGEYAHAMENSLGHFDQYWNLVHEYPAIQGGFIWDWVDQGLREKLYVTKDSSGNDISAGIMGRPQRVPGKHGQALSLSGIDDWIEVYRDPKLDIAGDQLTLAAWVFPRYWHGTNSLIAKGDKQYALEQTGQQRLTFSIQLHESETLEAKLPGDWEYNWHHVAATYDGAEMVIYIDGLRAAARKAKGNLRRSPHAVTIGRNRAVQHEQFQGWISNSVIDSVRIYGRALPASQIQSTDLPASGSILALDFEEFEDKGEHLVYGASIFSANGVIFADRTVQPETWQMKRSHQPVTIRIADLRRGKLRVTNRHSFTNLSELDASWKLIADGRAIDSGTLDVDIPPRTGMIIDVPVEQPRLAPGVDYWLLVQFTLPADTAWAKKGHEVAFAQYRMPWSAPKLAVKQGTVEYTDTESAVTVTGDNFRYVFDKRKMQLASLNYEGREILQQGPLTNVWRAPIPNETSNWGQAEAEWWYAAGLDQPLEFKPARFEISRVDGPAVRLHVHTNGFAGGPNQSFLSCYVYKFLPSGDILLDHEVIPEGDDLPWLPKIGMRIRLPEQFRNVSWYGRGPFETYPDRQSGAKVGFYSKDVDDLYVPYLTGQDQGNMAAVRWIALTDEAGAGLAVFAPQPINASVHQHHNFDRTVYAYQLQKADGLILNIDQKVTGVGGTPVTARPEYRAYPDYYTRKVRLRPLAPGDDPNALHKQDVR